ncbi:MAG: FAD:protein FMN transferase [Bryobacterales bacterium]|nr:FAD:protein FMN transferase [Bryobacterales bacterium]
MAAEPFEFTEPHMGTLFRVKLYADSAQSARAGAQAAFRRVRELDARLSDYKPDSELNSLSTDPRRLSADLFAVLEHALRVARETGGAFDVTAGPVIRLWREARKTGVLPSGQQVEAAMRVSGYRNLGLDPASRSAYLRVSGMQLDLGGIAKGYAADEALRVLGARGIARALVAASGDIAIGDAPPGSEGWRIGIDPFERGPGFERVLTLKNRGVSTSGDANQYAEIGGARYSHIVDPRTGIALTGRIAVTVIADSCMAADALATAGSVLPEYPENVPGVRVFITLGGE